MGQEGGEPAGVCIARPSSPVSASPPGVVFETDFSQNTGYVQGRTKDIETEVKGPGLPPQGWDGVRVAGDSRIEVIEGEGVGGTNALYLNYEGGRRASLGLFKHLTGDRNTGYDELYVRYQVRFPDDFKAGRSDKSMTFWKWGRLWQNTAVVGDYTPGYEWTENRENSGYVVWNTAGNPPYTDWNFTAAENSGEGLEYGSRSGPRQRLDWYASPSADRSTQDGYFESMADGAWRFDDETRYFLDRNQQYHTLEWRFKLATTPTSDDGVIEMWYDGVKQEKWTRLDADGGAPTRTGIPTANRGSGFNFLSMFDNIDGWNATWNDSGVEGAIWVNDVVVSTTRIGHDYLPQGSVR